MVGIAHPTTTTTSIILEALLPEVYQRQSLPLLHSQAGAWEREMGGVTPYELNNNIMNLGACILFLIFNF